MNISCDTIFLKIKIKNYLFLYILLYFILIRVFFNKISRNYWPVFIDSVCANCTATYIRDTINIWLANEQTGQKKLLIISRAPFFSFLRMLPMLPRLWISLKNFYFRFCVYYAILTPTRWKGFVFWLLPLVIWHILEGPAKSLICMDFMQFSTVAALDNFLYQKSHPRAMGTE